MKTSALWIEWGAGAGGHRGPAWADVDEGSQLSEQPC